MLSQPVVDLLAALDTDGAAVFRKVSGAADFSAAKDDLINAPAAYVIPLADAARPDTLLGASVEQHVAERFGVVLAVKNARDTRGDAANAALEALRRAVIRALLGFVPEEGYDPVQYGGGRLLALDVHTLWWQLDFSTGYHERSI